MSIILHHGCFTVNRYRHSIRIKQINACYHRLLHAYINTVLITLTSATVAMSISMSKSKLSNTTSIFKSTFGGSNTGYDNHYYQYGIYDGHRCRLDNHTNIAIDDRNMHHNKMTSHVNVNMKYWSHHK